MKFYERLSEHDKVTPKDVKDHMNPFMIRELPCYSFYQLILSMTPMWILHINSQSESVKVSLSTFFLHPESEFLEQGCPFQEI